MLAARLSSRQELTDVLYEVQDEESIASSQLGLLVFSGLLYGRMLPDLLPVSMSEVHGLVLDSVFKGFSCFNSSTYQVVLESFKLCT